MQRADDVRRNGKQALAFDQGFADKPEIAGLEIAQAPMDQLRAGGGGVGGEVVLLDEKHLETPAGGIASNPRTVDAATDDQQVDWRSHSVDPLPPYCSWKDLRRAWVSGSNIY